MKNDDRTHKGDFKKFYLKKSQFAMKLDNDLSAIDNKHEYLIKGSPVKFEKDNFNFEKSQFRATEKFLKWKEVSYT